MPPAPASSFIPKRNSGQKPKQARVKSVFLLSIISYSLFIAAPLASAGVFIYKLQVDKSAAATLEEVARPLAVFNESDYLRLLDFNDPLSAANALNGSHISIASALDILAKSTAETVQFNKIEFERTSTNLLTVNAELETSAFDGALFQRGQYAAEDSIESSQFEDVTLVSTEVATGEVQSSSQPVTAGLKTVTLAAEFTFTADTIAYNPQTTTVVNETPVVELPPATSSAPTAVSESDDTTP
jgi:hypothetical protein